MKSFKKDQIIKIVSFILFIAIFGSLNIVYAKTSSQIKFCDYSGVRRTFKIIGIVINIIKVVVPLLVMFSAIVAFFKVAMSGKTDDLKASLMQIVKNGIAGFIIFLLPTVIDFAFDSLIGYDDSGFTTCTNCLLDIDHCEIPTEDPITYEDDK